MPGWLCAQTPAHPNAPEPVWPDNFAGRVAALALIQSLNADLLSHDSATLTIERWCAAHALAPVPKISAQLIRGIDKPAPPEIRTRLQVSAEEPVRYRRVQLTCGVRLLSEADNWYVPARLTPEMNRLLEETDTPFGKVVLSLGFSRKTLSARLLWSPLPEGWETGKPPLPPAGSGALAIPEHLFEHRALLTTHMQIPFSEVVETYRRDILAFAPPVPE